MMLLDSYKYGGGGALLFDIQSDGRSGYSVRKLKDNYSGACLRVRRSSDNAEQDIGFVGEDLDEGALTTFVGANDGYVVTWYDQLELTATSYFTQTTTTLQPLIVSSGTVIKDNGKPAIDFTATGKELRSNPVVAWLGPVFSGFYTAHYNAASVPVVGASSSGYSHFRKQGASSTYTRHNGTNITSAFQPSNNVQHLLSIIRPNSTDCDLYVDNTLEDSITTLNNDFIINNCIIGKTSGLYQELVWFDTSKTAALSVIHGNINDYFGMY